MGYKREFGTNKMLVQVGLDVTQQHSTGHIIKGTGPQHILELVRMKPTDSIPKPKGASIQVCTCAKNPLKVEGKHKYIYASNSFLKLMVDLRHWIWRAIIYDGPVSVPW
jgi:hypothetical protein